jgi:acetyl esterase/lipase
MPKTSHWFSVALRGLAVATACGLILVRLLNASDVVVEANLVYGRVGDVDLLLDLAHPTEGAGPRPAIVFIHGGAWAGGSRTDYRSTIERAARRGYVAATIDYRLTQVDLKTKVGKVPFPAQIHDCKCAIRWLRSVATTYHIDVNRIGVSGGSAGGHLSLLVGLIDPMAGLEGNGGHAEQSSRVQAVVNYCGPTELSAAYADVNDVQVFLNALCGGTPESAAEAYRVASPVTYVSMDAPPVLTLHGEKDTIVLVSQARLFDDAMKKAGARHELIVFEGSGHAFEGDANKRAEQAMWDFFDKQLKP